MMSSPWDGEYCIVKMWNNPWNGTRPGNKSAENVSWGVGFAREIFDDGIVMLNIKFPLQYFTRTVVVKEKEVPVISMNGKWNTTEEVIKT